MRNFERHLILVMLLQSCLCDTSTDISVVTSTSKINRKTTPAPKDHSGPSAPSAPSAPQMEQEEQGSPSLLLEPLPPSAQIQRPGDLLSISGGLLQDKGGRIGAATLAEALAEPAIKSVVDQIYSKNSAGVINDSREALAPESSDRDSVVFLPESPAGYVPLTSLRGRPSSILSGAEAGGGHHLGSLGSLGSHYGADPHAAPSGIGSADLEQWRAPIEGWERDYRRYRFNNTRVQHIEAECQDDYMKIRVGFNGSFSGLLYSAGYAYDPDCMYINGTGRDYYEFYIQLNRCGTLGKNTHHEDNRKNPTKNFMWNTVTVQYNPLIEEEFDEHFKVTCEYGYDFWKTVTFPFLDVEVATGNPVVFTLTPPECYMEIRSGYGTGGARVAGPVRVGDPLTLIIYMRSKYDGFDLVVNDCYAHNGANKRIQMIDEHGCPVDDKLISRFRGSWSDSGVFETQVFAYMKTFRFTGSPALYIECDVRMCHGRCPTQPCHWRNTKILQKRSLLGDPSEPAAISAKTGTAAAGTGTGTGTAAAPSLSDNISLFQALRVLQEGEGENDDRNNDVNRDGISNSPAVNQTCVRTSVLSAILASLCASFGVICATLLVTCLKLRNRKHKRGATSTAGSTVNMYDSYINHKGQID